MWNPSQTDINAFFVRATFLGLTSLVLALIGYYLLVMIMPHGWVFGALIRMHLYHWQYPFLFILIPCAVYAILGSALSPRFIVAPTGTRIALTLVIILLTVLISSPLGGMLWHYIDIMEGFWPDNYWKTKLFVRGPIEGLQVGWAVILLSFPYAYFGSLIAYWLIAIMPKYLEQLGFSPFAQNESRTGEEKQKK